VFQGVIFAGPTIGCANVVCATAAVSKSDAYNNGFLYNAASARNVALV